MGILGRYKLAKKWKVNITWQFKLDLCYNFDYKVESRYYLSFIIVIRSNYSLITILLLPYLSTIKVRLKGTPFGNILKYQQETLSIFLLTHSRSARHRRRFILTGDKPSIALINNTYVRILIYKRCPYLSFDNIRGENPQY